MSQPFARRLEALEAAYGSRTCPACFNHPYRLVGIDEETGDVTSETMPDAGCPECGRPIVREMQIVGVDVTKI